MDRPLAVGSLRCFSASGYGQCRFGSMLMLHPSLPIPGEMYNAERTVATGAGRLNRRELYGSLYGVR
jgi:hypothetical protein